jgi:hypothetical protein
MSKWSSAFRDPRWQKKRLKFMERDGWACCSCGAQDRVLNVHHISYEAGKAPWEYPEETLVTWCEECHKKRHSMMQQMQEENAQLKQIAEGKQIESENTRLKIDADMKAKGAEIEQRSQQAARESDTRLEEARIRAEADATAKIEQARINAELEREKIASQERIALAQSMMQASVQQQQTQVEEGQQQAEQQNGEAVAQMAEMLKAMQGAIAQMGQQFAMSLGSLQTQLNAPRRVIRDPVTGDMIGVETVKMQ